MQLRLQMKYAGKLEVSITIKILVYGFQNTENSYMAHQKRDRVNQLHVVPPHVYYRGNVATVRIYWFGYVWKCCVVSN